MPLTVEDDVMYSAAGGSALWTCLRDRCCWRPHASDSVFSGIVSQLLLYLLSGAELRSDVTLLLLIELILGEADLL